MKSQLLAAVSTCLLGACATELPRNMPLVFGQSITLGVHVGQTTSDPGWAVKVGFDSTDIALIPVQVTTQGSRPEEDGRAAPTAGGQADPSAVDPFKFKASQLRASVRETRYERSETDTSSEPMVANDGATKDGKRTAEPARTKIVNENADSLSVFGQFSNATDGVGKKVGLGKFFATGIAAQQLANGFAERMRRETCVSACPPQAGEK